MNSKSGGRSRHVAPGLLGALAFAILLGLAVRRSATVTAPVQTIPESVVQFANALPELPLGDPLRVRGVGGGERPGYQANGGSSVAWTNDSVLLVFDGNDRQVHRFGVDGRALESLGNQGQGEGEFRDVKGGLAADGRIWVWDGGQRRFTVFRPDGELERDFLGRKLPEIIPGGAIGFGQDWCSWFGSEESESESDFLGGVPLTGTLAECLPAGDSVVVRSMVPGGRWLVGDQGQWVPHQLSMERHTRMLREGKVMIVPRQPGFHLPSPADENAPPFRMPVIQGNWADPAAPIWVRLAGQTIVYEPDGTPLGRVPAAIGEVLAVQRDVVISRTTIDGQTLVQVRPMIDPAVVDRSR